MLEALILGRAATFALVVSRIAGFVAVSPFPGNDVPVTQRIGLVAVFSLLVTSMAIPSAASPALDLTVVIPAATELGVGLAIGLAFRFTLAVADVLGGVLSHSIGLGTPSLFNPALGTQDTSLGHITGAFTMLLALGIGAHRTVLGYLLESFRALPVGRACALPAVAPLLISLADASILAGVRLAMPVLAMSVAIQVALAMLARAAPSLQIFSIGFTMLLLAGLSTLEVSLRGIGVGLVEHVATLATTLDRLFLALSGG